MSSAEFTEWQAEYLLEPWDDDRLMLAQIAHAVYTASGRYQPLKIDDFLPKRKVQRKSDPQRIYQWFKTLATAMGARKKTGDGDDEHRQPAHSVADERPAVPSRQ